ncbi:hypothetical protein [Fusobacterium sp. MFO224]|uniref:hypothetical protein n=1 Tax=Fusobacterium sp. MFO224 TaxID=3378070 RepID=UPI003854F276
MIKKFIILFFIIFSFSFSNYNDINDINDLTMTVHESTIQGSKKINKVYLIKYKLPDKLRKEMLEPKSHKGEIFIYKNDKKITYLPIFDEKIIDEASVDENIVSEFIKLFQKTYKKNPTFREKYNNSKKLLVKKDNLNIKILKFDIFSNYRMPVEMEIYDGDIFVGELKFYNVNINSGIKKSEFDI